MRPLAFLVFSQFIYLFIYLLIHLFVCLFIYLFIYSQIKKLEFTKTNHRL